MLHRLDERAGKAGMDREAYVRQLIERDLLPPDPRMTFREILAPVHASTEGIPDEELDDLLTEELDAVRRERRARPHRAQ